MFFLTPKYVKQGKLYIKAAEKKLAYNSDVWSAETCAQMEAHIASLKAALNERSREKVAAAEKTIEEFCGRFCPVGPNAWMTENVEVVLVAIIVALGIRTYIVQPFTIPTSSMSPTLKGITGQRTTEEPPNILMRALQWATHGRTWHDVIAKDDENIIAIETASRPFPRNFFSYTRIRTDRGNEYFVNEMKDPVTQYLSPERRTFRKGEPILRGYSDTGDHVFVNKFAFHFRKPTRGEVIVFLTQNIEGIVDGQPPAGPPPQPPSQFYIKRLAGVPGDELSIVSPQLYVNGQPGQEAGFQRVGRGTPTDPVDKSGNPADMRFWGYQGYNFGPQGGRDFNMTSPQTVFRVPEKRYFPLGDNSYHSKDGRYFGSVPQENMCGSGFLVYWPFMRDGGTHFGLIR